MEFGMELSVGNDHRNGAGPLEEQQVLLPTEPSLQCLCAYIHAKTYTCRDESFIMGIFLIIVHKMIFHHSYLRLGLSQSLTG